MGKRSYYNTITTLLKGRKISTGRISLPNTLACLGVTGLQTFEFFLLLNNEHTYSCVFNRQKNLGEEGCFNNTETSSQNVIGLFKKVFNQVKL